MRCDFCQYLPRLVRHRVRPLQRLRHVLVVDAVRVVVALTEHNLLSEAH